MSAQVTLRDGEMEVLLKAASELASVAQSDAELLGEREKADLARVTEKLRGALDRPGVRYAKMRR